MNFGAEGYANRTIGDDYSMFKRKRKPQANRGKDRRRVRVTDSILDLVVPNVPTMAGEQAEQAIAKVFVICDIRESAPGSVGESVCPYRRRSIPSKQ